MESLDAEEVDVGSEAESLVIALAPVVVTVPAEPELNPADPDCVPSPDPALVGLKAEFSAKQPTRAANPARHAVRRTASVYHAAFMGRSTTSASWARRLWWLAAALVVAPAAVAGAVIVTHLAAFDVPQGDIATLEIRVLHALRGEQLLGAYSRFGASHPGPLYFYLAAPLYAAMGRAGGALYVAATLINLTALGLLVWVVRSGIERPRARATVLAAATLLVLGTFDAHQPLAIATPWNPYVALLPFATLLVLATIVARGRLALLPLAVFAHAFTSQTHTAYLIPSTAAVATAVVLGWRRGQSLRPIGLSAAIAAVVWFPTLIDQFWGRGNLTRVATVAFTGEKIGLDAPAVAKVLVTKLGFGFAPALVFLIAGLVWILIDQRRDREQPSWTFAAIAAVQIAAAVLVVFRLDKPRDYLIAWLDPIAMLAWTAIALGGVSRVRPPERRPWLVPAGLCVLAAVTTGRVAQTSRARIGEHAIRRQEGSESVRGLAKAARVEGANADETAPLWLIETHDVWSVFAGVVALEYRNGVRPRLDDGWRNMFGHGFEFAGDGPNVLYFGRSETTAWVRREHHPPLHLADAVGVIGDPRLIVDGEAPVDGTTASKNNSARLVGPDAAITVRTDGQTVSGLELTAIGDARFTVEGSLDGVRFDQLGIVNRSNRGLRTRTVEPVWDAVRPPTFLRVRLHSGRGRLWIAEIRVRSDEILAEVPL